MVAREANSRPPRKIGRHLRLFDCITCDKCIPVCPSDALFAFRTGKIEVPVGILDSTLYRDDRLTSGIRPRLRLTAERRHGPARPEPVP